MNGIIGEVTAEVTEEATSEVIAEVRAEAEVIAIKRVNTDTKRKKTNLLDFPL
jgi:hypothetical protein